MICVQTVTIITTSPSFYPTLHNLLDILYHINGSPKSEQSDRKEFHTLTMAWFKSTLNMGLTKIWMRSVTPIDILAGDIRYPLLSADIECTIRSPCRTLKVTGLDKNKLTQIWIMWNI